MISMFISPCHTETSSLGTLNLLFESTTEILARGQFLKPEWNANFWDQYIAQYGAIPHFLHNGMNRRIKG